MFLQYKSHTFFEKKRSSHDDYKQWSGPKANLVVEDIQKIIVPNAQNTLTREWLGYKDPLYL
jgi:hypothetical protein